MAKARGISILGAVALAVALCTSTASAATLAGDYQLQGSLASSGAGPVLTQAGTGGPTSFQSENVMGTNRQVLVFPQDTGLSMLPSVGTGDVPYSVVTTFRFQSLDLYRRILDQSQGGSDTGFYDYNGAADIFGVGEATGGQVFTPNTYATVALTSTPSAKSRFYVNGTLAVDLNETFAVVGDNLRFFLDNGSENSAGAVSCIRVFTGVLTDAEVAAIGSSPTCQAPAPPPAKKKCKKHKKKHRSAESAKKKKCKKKKKG